VLFLRKKLSLGILIILICILFITLVVAGPYKNPTIVFESNPSNAEVWVQTCNNLGCTEEVEWGNTPLYQMECGSSPPFYYQVRFAKDGYYDYLTTITASSDSSTTYVFANLIQKPTVKRNIAAELKLIGAPVFLGNPYTQKAPYEEFADIQQGRDDTGGLPEYQSSPSKTIPVPEFPSLSPPVLLLTGLLGAALLTQKKSEN
jgi:hypothetical protein